MHAEMPIHRDAEGKKLPDPVGLQLWLDLPEASKKDPPTYQEFPKEGVPLALPRPDQPEETEGAGWSVKVIAGESRECIAEQAEKVTDPLFLPLSRRRPVAGEDARPG